MQLHPAFMILFLLALARRTWRLNSSTLIIQLLSKLFESKESLSKGSRTASNTYLIPFEHQNSKYKLVLSNVRRQKMRWIECVAIMSDGVQKDVTLEIQEMAGPYKDFFGLHKQYKPDDLVRDSVKLFFYDKKKKLILSIGETVETPVEITLQPQPPIAYTELTFGDE